MAKITLLKHSYLWPSVPRPENVIRKASNPRTFCLPNVESRNEKEGVSFIQQTLLRPNQPDPWSQESQPTWTTTRKRLKENRTCPPDGGLRSHSAEAENPTVTPKVLLMRATWQVYFEHNSVTMRTWKTGHKLNDKQKATLQAKYQIPIGWIII